MKAAVIGASGLVGSHLMKTCKDRGWDVMGTYSEHAQKGLIPLHMADPASIEEAMQKMKPEVVFLTAFNPNADYCEEHPKETWETNVQGNANVIEASQRIGAKTVYYSSDYIFNGKSGPYEEDATPDPICEYGKQKLAVEQMIRRLTKNHLIIRTTVVYGWEEQGKNFFCNLLAHLERGEEMKVPSDQIGTPTLVNDLAEASCSLVEVGASGIVNVAGPDRMSRYEFALHIARIFDLPVSKIIPVTTMELKQPARRPLNAGLLYDRLFQLANLQMKGVETGIRYLKETEKQTP
ncbi:MAG: SDR family oxidoreductase [Candidatus Peribacteraceae bacterium]|nr:SDR family oxidoreductase [Candidatus Peribacteraceae bacterium]